MAFKYTFQHYLDISTSASSITMLKVRAGGKYAMERCKHLIGAYKYAKLGNVSIKLIPASTLPVDPLGLSYASDDPQTVDPRDQLNPGLVRITNGESIFDDLSNVTDEQMEQMYVNTMLDPRWSKFMLQSGFKRHATPLYWTVGQLKQTVYPDAFKNVPGIDSTDADNPVITNVTSFGAADYFPGGADVVGNFRGWSNRSDSDPRGLFQTGHKGRLGWMPTDAWEWFHDGNGVNFSQAEYQPFLCPELITVILPKAHKTLYYYRMFITETIYFSGIKNVGINDESGYEYRAFDNFMHVYTPKPSPPTTNWPEGDFGVDPLNDGDTSD